MKNSTHQKVQGTAKVIIGDIKEAAGKVVGNTRLQAAGKAEQVAGKAQKRYGVTEKALGL